MIIIDSIKRYMRRRKEDREFQQMAYSIIAEMNKKNALSHTITCVIVDKAIDDVNRSIMRGGATYKVTRKHFGASE